LTELTAALCRYAQRMHATIPASHHVASPLGAWLVLALASKAADDSALRTDITDALGLPPEEAVAAARRLLEQPHTAVRLAAAAWHRATSGLLDSWLATLGETVESGPVPSQRQADRWAEEHTLGLINQFPLALDERVMLVLATAVATVIEWQTPFTTCPAEELVLPPSPEFSGTSLWLHSPKDALYQRIVDTTDGAVAVHAMVSSNADMLVVSVIGDPDIAGDAVLGHAHRIAVALARGEPVAGERSLFDLPLGAGHSWVLEERREARSHRSEQFDIVLPTWSANSTHRLLELGVPGFRAAAEALRTMIDGAGTDAAQVAMAKYTRTGFKAAAVTGFAVATAIATRPAMHTVRHARIEFGHPYAAVAVATGAQGAWRGVPLFSAWVAAADEP
jgi:hypothetical protein